MVGIVDRKTGCILDSEQFHPGHLALGLAHGAGLMGSAGPLQIGPFPPSPACPRPDFCGCFYAVAIMDGGADWSGCVSDQAGELSMVHFEFVFCSRQKTLAHTLAAAWSRILEKLMLEKAEVS